jgi:hypothetical protein
VDDASKRSDHSVTPISPAPLDPPPTPHSAAEDAKTARPAPLNSPGTLPVPPPRSAAAQVAILAVCTIGALVLARCVVSSGTHRGGSAGVTSPRTALPASSGTTAPALVPTAALEIAPTAVATVKIRPLTPKRAQPKHADTRPEPTPTAETIEAAAAATTDPTTTDERPATTTTP